MKREKTIDKKFRIFPLLLALTFAGCSDSGEQDTVATGTIEHKVQQLLAQMSIEEKVGQMTQVSLEVVLDTSRKDGVIRIDPQKLREAVHTYKAGSILYASVDVLPLETWHSITRAIWEEAAKTPHKIPVLHGVDSIHGATYAANSTLFPHNIGMAATRNPDLVRRAAKITAAETRAMGVRWNFDPVLDIGRQPLRARFPETFGEDPHLVKAMGMATVLAYEEDGLRSPTAVASCLKYFTGYSAPASGKDRTPASISDIDLWEYHLPQFQAAIAAGASTIMLNSASINGIPVHGSRHLLHDVLRKQLGFKGLIVTDWEDIIRLHTRHKVAETPELAVKAAVDAGIDMSMAPHDFSFFTHLVSLVEKGAVPEQRLDESVAIILRLKFQLGLFDNPLPEPEAIALFGRKEYAQVALNAARQSITLLKNEGDVLPLPKSARILLAGPAADSRAALNGGWSYTRQGKDETRYPAHYQGIADAFRDKIGAAQLVHHGVRGFERPENYDSQGLIRKAQQADYIVLALGEDAYAESSSSIDDLTLPAEQLALARAALSTGKPVILLLAQGRPRIIREIEGGMKAVVQAYRPGSQGAQAIADVVFGDYNPSGLLPYSYPRFSGDINPYDRKPSADIHKFGGYESQWPFGHGLSYTRFKYSPLDLDSQELTENGGVQVYVTVTNTGERDASHALDLYVQDLYASVVPSVKRLKKFRKVFIPAGRAFTVGFTLRPQDLTFVGRSLQRVVEPGEFKIIIGQREAKLRYIGPKQVFAEVDAGQKLFRGEEAP